METMQGLYDVILSRKAGLPENSYTAYLFEAGLDKILKKVGEESAETIIAAKNGVRDDLVCEVSDLLYHVLVMLAQKGIPWREVEDELSRRARKIGNLKPVRQTDRES